MKVLFTYDYGKEKMKAVEALGYDLLYIPEKYVTNTPEITDIDVLVCYDPFQSLDINKLQRLKWIQLSSIGIDQLPKASAMKNNIIITNNKSGYSIPIGEWIVLKTLELIKNSRRFYEQQRGRLWKIDTGILELYNKTVCFIGTGSIANEAAKRLQGFDVNLLGVNTTGKASDYIKECYALEHMSYVLSKADIVVLTIPYTNKTHHLINENNLKYFKRNSYLINVSRGSVVNENDLIKALETGMLKGAALDVFTEEPLSAESRLWELDNVIITPHNSWISELRNERRYNIIYRNLKKYINNEELINIVNTEKGY